LGAIYDGTECVSLKRHYKNRFPQVVEIDQTNPTNESVEVDVFLHHGSICG